MTRKGPEGSNPSPGAHLEEISVCFKTDGCGREPKAVKAVTRRQRRINASSSLNDATTVVTSSPTQEKQARTEGQDYEASLDRLIDSITRDFSRKWINSRLKALAKKSSRNSATICDHILAEQTEHNIKTSTAIVLPYYHILFTHLCFSYTVLLQAQPNLYVYCKL